MRKHNDVYLGIKSRVLSMMKFRRPDLVVNYIHFPPDDLQNIRLLVSGYPYRQGNKARKFIISVAAIESF